MEMDGCRYVTVQFVEGIKPFRINVDENKTCESVIQKSIEYAHPLVSTTSFDGPAFASAFGLLVLPKKDFWLPEWHRFDSNKFQYTELQLCVRYHPLTEKYDSNLTGNFLGQYLFLQMKDEFNLGSLGESEMSTTSMLGLLSVSLFMPNSLPFDNSVKIDDQYVCPNLTFMSIGKKVSKYIKRNIYKNSPWDKYWACRSLNTRKDKYMVKDQPLFKFMVNFYKRLLEECNKDFKVFERYEAESLDTSPSRPVTVVLQLCKENNEPWIYYFQFQQCPLSAIKDLQLIPPENQNNLKWRVNLVLKRGYEDKSLSFKEEGDALSFISGVQGLAKLGVQYDICLYNGILHMDSHKMRRRLQSFGPLWKERIKELLFSDDDNQNCRDKFLICESSTKFNTFVVMILRRRTLGRDEGEAQIEELEIKFEDSFFHLDGQYFRLFSEIWEHLNCVQVVPNANNQDFAEINKWYKSEHLDYYVADEEEEPQSENSLIYRQEDITDVGIIKDKSNPFLYKRAVQVKGIPMTLVIVNSKDSDVQKAFCDGLATCIKLRQLSERKPNQFVRLCGSIVNPSCPKLLTNENCPAFLMEHAPHGDLLTFLCKPQKLHVKVEIIMQMIDILEVLEKNGLTHGNIRCRRFSVFVEPGYVYIKLGDPGVTGYLDKLPLDDEDKFNEERFPWLAPERRDTPENLKKITIESERYAFGTTFYEILCRDDAFDKQLNTPMRGAEVVKAHLIAGNNLPKPIVLREGEELPIDEAPSPEVRQVLEDIYKNLILRCWSNDPRDRPNSKQLKYEMEDIKEDTYNITSETQQENWKDIMYDTESHRESTKIKQEEIDAFRIKYQHLYLPSNMYVKGKELGDGHYGVVYEGIAKKPRFNFSPNEPEVSEKVAIKQLKKNCGTFMKEVMIATELVHPNIVKVKYFSSDRMGSANGINTLIMEYMDGGSLERYIKNNPSLLPADRLKIIIDVVKGMVYLSGKKKVHRDLAARNVLLTFEGGASLPTAKVSDFGLSRSMEKGRDFYSIKGRDCLPFYWMPPELQSGQFTDKGDIWSFGVLMWEVFSCGIHPRSVLDSSEQNERSYHEKIERGWRLPRTWAHRNMEIPEDIYKVMTDDCWHADPEKRLVFVELEQKLKSLPYYSEM